MDAWLSYRPEDFLLFSEPVYWRLFELHNAALWPAQIPALIAGLVVLVLLVRPTPWAGRVIAGVLTLAWATSALSFLPRYTTINWLAEDLIPVFLVQAAILFLVGVARDGLIRRSDGPQHWVAVVLCLYAVVLHPIIAMLDGRSLTGAEVFALTPDPTAVMTLGALLAAGTRLTVWLAMPIPLLWCLASATTLWTVGTWEAAVPLGAAAIAVTAGLRAGRTNRVESA